MIWKVDACKPAHVSYPISWVAGPGVLCSRQLLLPVSQSLPCSVHHAAAAAAIHPLAPAPECVCMCVCVRVHMVG